MDKKKGAILANSQDVLKQTSAYNARQFSLNLITMSNPLLNITPIDGRYHSKCVALNQLTSEYGLIYYRTLVEVRWLQQLAAEPLVKECPPMTADQSAYLDAIVTAFSEADAQIVKDFEATTNHDVKAVEYFIKQKLNERDDLQVYAEFVHFACTSEDINNLAYALQLADVRAQVLLPELTAIAKTLDEMAHEYAEIPMLSRTHGQSASPTTLGKEVRNVEQRLARQLKALAQVELLGKINGAVGNFNAHAVTYPEVDWRSFSKTFVTQSLGLVWNAHTTQIEPHDCVAELFHALIRINTILMDLCRDIWGYISLGYFKQKVIEGEVGSSTMPHKVNPIDFENAEGNFGLSSALLDHLAMKLPISRWQRDLTDSTVLRNIGSAFAYAVIAFKSLQKGLGKLEVNQAKLAEDLDQNWEVLAEAIQTVMRRYGIESPYEKLKAFTRGKRVNVQEFAGFIQSLELPQSVKEALCQMTPADYTGYAVQLAQHKLH